MTVAGIAGSESAVLLRSSRALLMFLSRYLKFWYITFSHISVQIPFRSCHPNILRLLGFTVESGFHCLIYPYMPNGSLMDRLQCQVSNQFACCVTVPQKYCVKNWHTLMYYTRNSQHGACQMLLDNNFHDPRQLVLPTGADRNCRLQQLEGIIWLSLYDANVALAAQMRGKALWPQSLASYSDSHHFTKSCSGSLLPFRKKSAAVASQLPITVAVEMKARTRTPWPQLLAKGGWTVSFSAIK